MDKLPLSKHYLALVSIAMMLFCAMLGGNAFAQYEYVKQGAKRAGQKIKAIFVAIFAAIAAFFKWLASLFSSKKRRQ